jgi:hypothetical protein
MAPSSRIGRLDGRAHPRTIRGTPVPGARRHRRPVVGTLLRVTHRSTVLRFCTSARAVIALAVLAVFVAACGGGAPASFDVAAGCPVEGRVAGAYPDLEKRIPTSYEGRAPDTLDSGRHCDPDSLGSLAKAGFDEVRFAGGTWDFGGERAAALVVFEAPGLTANQIADFYGTSAQGANRTTITGVSTPEISGRSGYRLNTMTGDRVQTVVVWPSATSDVVNVVITNDLPDPKIQSAIDAFSGA